MDAADKPAKRVKTEDRPKAAERDKALDDLVAELFFELESAESEGPRSWLQLEWQRTRRSG